MISTGMTVSVAEQHGLDVAYTEFHDNNALSLCVKRNGTSSYRL